MIDCKYKQQLEAESKIKKNFFTIKEDQNIDNSLKDLQMVNRAFIKKYTRLDNKKTLKSLAKYFLNKVT